MSESPTHPGAPRAGGETPDLDVAATRRLLAKIERDYRDSAYACDASSFGSLGATRRRIADDVAQLRTALPSLLARHRDGEREYDAKLREIAALERDWDSYGAGRIEPQAIDSARRILAAISADADVVPTSSGGIQLEWHRDGVNLEIFIEADGSIEEPPFVELSAGPSPERASK